MPKGYDPFHKPGDFQYFPEAGKEAECARHKPKATALLRQLLKNSPGSTSASLHVDGGEIYVATRPNVIRIKVGSGLFVGAPDHSAINPGASVLYPDRKFNVAIPPVDTPSSRLLRSGQHLLGTEYWLSEDFKLAVSWQGRNVYFAGSRLAATDPAQVVLAAAVVKGGANSLDLLVATHPANRSKLFYGQVTVRRIKATRAGQDTEWGALSDTVVTVTASVDFVTVDWVLFAPSGTYFLVFFSDNRDNFIGFNGEEYYFARSDLDFADNTASAPAEIYRWQKAYYEALPPGSNVTVTQTVGPDVPDPYISGGTMAFNVRRVYTDMSFGAGSAIRGKGVNIRLAERPFMVGDHVYAVGFGVDEDRVSPRAYILFESGEWAPPILGGRPGNYEINEWRLRDNNHVEPLYGAQISAGDGAAVRTKLLDVQVAAQEWSRNNTYRWHIDENRVRVVEIDDRSNPVTGFVDFRPTPLASKDINRLVYTNAYFKIVVACEKDYVVGPGGPTTRQVRYVAYVGGQATELYRSPSPVTAFSPSAAIDGSSDRRLHDTNTYANIEKHLVVALNDWFFAGSWVNVRKTLVFGIKYPARTASLAHVLDGDIREYGEGAQRRALTATVDFGEARPLPP